MTVLVLPEVQRFTDRKLKKGATRQGLFHDAIEEFRMLSEAQKNALYRELATKWPFRSSNFRNKTEEIDSLLYNAMMLHLRDS